MRGVTRMAKSGLLEARLAHLLLAELRGQDSALFLMHAVSTVLAIAGDDLRDALVLPDDDEEVQRANEAILTPMKNRAATSGRSPMKGRAEIVPSRVEVL